MDGGIFDVERFIHFSLVPIEFDGKFGPMSLKQVCDYFCVTCINLALARVACLTFHLEYPSLCMVVESAQETGRHQLGTSGSSPPSRPTALSGASYDLDNDSTSFRFQEEAGSCRSQSSR